MPPMATAAIVISSVKMFTMVCKGPYVPVAVMQSVPMATFFMLATGWCGLLGAWLLPRFLQKLSARAAVWFVQTCSVLGNVWAVVHPESLLPLVLGSAVSTGSMGAALLAGCAEHLQASDAEHARWGQYATNLASAVSALSMLVVPLFLPEFYQINFVCTIADLFATGLMFAVVLPTKQAPLPPTWSWAQTLRALRAVPARWSFTWSLLQAMEHGIMELTILVHFISTFQLTAAEVGFIAVVTNTTPMLYSSLAGARVERWSGRHLRPLLLGAMVVASFSRWASFRVSSRTSVFLLACGCQFIVVMLGHLKQIMLSRSLDVEYQAEGTAVLQGVAGGVVSIANPTLLMVLDATYTPEALSYAWMITAASVILFGQAVLWLLPPGSAKSKEA